jgi:hypothetical protein
LFYDSADEWLGSGNREMTPYDGPGDKPATPVTEEMGLLTWKKH